MKKIVLVEVIIAFICFITLFSVHDTYSNYLSEEEINASFDYEDNWNDGYCEVCNGRLIFRHCGSKYAYQCDSCDRYFVFNNLKSYKTP